MKSYEDSPRASIDALFKANIPPESARKTYAQEYAHLCQPEIFGLLAELGYHPINAKQANNKTHWTFCGNGTHIRVYLATLDACIHPGESQEKLQKLENMVRYINLHPVRVLQDTSTWGGKDEYGRIN